MLISLHEAASFLAQYYPVVDELWRRREHPLTDAEMLSVIDGTRPTTAPIHILSQLKRLRLVVESDLQTGIWELAPAFVQWLDHLQQISRPVSSAVVAGRMTELEHLLHAFQTAMQLGDVADGRDILGDARRCYQRLLEDLVQTRIAITSAVSETKNEHRRQPARERFRRINRLWKDYLVPIVDLLNPAGALEAISTRWEIVLNQAIEAGFLPDERLAQRVEREMQALRLSLRHSFRDCRNELEPLHARLRRDSLLAEGAARILRLIERNGAEQPVLAASLPLSAFRYFGQIPGPALAAAAALWKESTEPPPVIDFGGVATPDDAQALEDTLAEIEELPDDRFPIPDLLGWLAEHYAARGFQVVLQVFSFLVTDARFSAEFSLPLAEYQFAQGAVRCGRVTLRIRSS